MRIQDVQVGSQYHVDLASLDGLVTVTAVEPLGELEDANDDDMVIAVSASFYVTAAELRAIT